jgi:hypothetical protein
VLTLGRGFRIGWMLAAGLLPLAHAGWDRAFGHGLKSRAGFRMPHPG